MTASASNVPVSASRATLLLPIAYLFHLAEEWIGDLPAWTQSALGTEISAERFVLINTIAIPVIVAAAWIAFRYPRKAWISATLAALFGLNGVVHALGTLAFGQYSPGMVTGLLLYIPLSVIVLRSVASQIQGAVLFVAIMSGVLLHGLITFFALL